jgi:hypothetical protein
MPAFTFEKIAPPSGGPVRSAATSAASSTTKKQRGVIVQILDRFAETRAKRSLREDNGVAARKPPRARK